MSSDDQVLLEFARDEIGADVGRTRYADSLKDLRFKIMLRKNALARAVFFNRLGELRDRSFENQRYRASGLNLVVAAIVLWNTVYLERSTAALREHGQAVDDKLLQHLSPLGWEHINLTGDYIWRQHRLVESGKFRPLRPFNGS